MSGVVDVSNLQGRRQQQEAGESGSWQPAPAGKVGWTEGGDTRLLLRATTRSGQARQTRCIAGAGGGACQGACCTPWELESLVAGCDRKQEAKTPQVPRRTCVYKRWVPVETQKRNKEIEAECCCGQSWVRK
jgi:hypothetical protein